MSSNDYDPWESDDRSPQDEYDRMTSAAEANDDYVDWKNGNQYRCSNSNNNKNTSNGCFIATAAYGSPLQEEVVSLRIFRDTILLNHTAGRFFVGYYYVISPPIANVIKNSELAKFITKMMLRPIITIVDWVNNHHKYEM